MDCKRNLLILPTKQCKKYCIFRYGNAKLPNETGRWFNIPIDIRICNSCACNEFRDEFHYLYKCTNVYQIQGLCIYQNISYQIKSIKML